MRRIIWTFVVLSPLIALAHNEHWPVFSGTADAGLAHAVITTTTVRVAQVVHVVRTLLG